MFGFRNLKILVHSRNPQYHDYKHLNNIQKIYVRLPVIFLLNLLSIDVFRDMKAHFQLMLVNRLFEKYLISLITSSILTFSVFEPQKRETNFKCLWLQLKVIYNELIFILNIRCFFLEAATFKATVLPIYLTFITERNKIILNWTVL